MTFPLLSLLETDPASALKQASARLATAPKDVEALLVLSTQRYLEEDFAGAQALLSKLPPEARTGYDAQLLEAAGLLQQGGKAQARALFQKLTAKDPKRFEAFNALGQIANEDGRLDEAKKAFEQAAALNPTHFMAALGLALTLAELKDPGAEAALKRAAHINANDVRLYAAFTDVYLSQGRVDDAEQLLALVREAAQGEPLIEDCWARVQAAKPKQ